MTAAQRLSQIFGWAFILIGLAGFAATGMSMTADHTLAPRLFGLFPVNALHNVVHLVFGVWGVLGARSYGGARAYLLGAGLTYLVLAALGYITPNGLGLVPLGGNDIGLHLFLGLGLLLSGMVTTRRDADVGRGARAA
jgi:ABC-type multidrug transport system permease subunit